MGIAELFCNQPREEALPDFVRAVEDRNGVRIIRLQGPVGNSIGPDVEKLTQRLAKEEGAFNRSLLLDFANTEGANFSTVAYLVEAVHRRLGSGRRVGIINAPEELLGTLDIAKMQELLSIFDSEQQALAELDG